MLDPRIHNDTNGLMGGPEHCVAPFSKADLDTQGLNPRSGNLSESRFLYDGSAMKLIGGTEHCAAPFSTANLDIEGLDPRGGNLDGEAEVLYEDDLLVILAGGALLLTLLTALLPLLLLLRTGEKKSQN
jgi:hypothetical protein